MKNTAESTRLPNTTSSGNEMRVTGFIVTRANALCGWISDLAYPQMWIPGSLAIAVNGSEMYVAAGGNEKRGATAWEKRGHALMRFQR